MSLETMPTTMDGFTKFLVNDTRGRIGAMFGNHLHLDYENFRMTTMYCYEHPYEFQKSLQRAMTENGENRYLKSFLTVLENDDKYINTLSIMTKKRHSNVRETRDVDFLFMLEIWLTLFH